MSSTAAEPNRPAPATTPADLAADSPEAILERAGYKPELRRSLRFFSMFAIAFSIISITTGIFLDYGFGLAYCRSPPRSTVPTRCGATAWSWPRCGTSAAWCGGSGTAPQM
jgi:hypothetical protein